MEAYEIGEQVSLEAERIISKTIQNPGFSFPIESGRISQVESSVRLLENFSNQHKALIRVRWNSAKQIASQMTTSPLSRVLVWDRLMTRILSPELYGLEGARWMQAASVEIPSFVAFLSSYEGKDFHALESQLLLKYISSSTYAQEYLAAQAEYGKTDIPKLLKKETDCDQMVENASKMASLFLQVKSDIGHLNGKRKTCPITLVPRVGFRFFAQLAVDCSLLSNLIMQNVADPEEG